MPSIFNTFNRNAVTEDTIINRLLAANVIVRTGTRGVYSIPTRGLTHATRPVILDLFAVRADVGGSQPKYILRPIIVDDAQPANRPQVRPRRTIPRYLYHSQDRNIRSALDAISHDADGVRRSFGLEWEIYSLTEAQESALAYLLDTLPAHVTERDASLASSGVEIVFEPMSEEAFINTFAILKQFSVANNVQMEGTGAHVTYGVSNASCTLNDLQIRLNRLALAVKSVGTQRAIADLFGRDFSSYCALPTGTTTHHHSNAFSASRGESAWECRLVSWKANPNNIVNFLKDTEYVFSRPVQREDFMKIFDLLDTNSSDA